MSIRRAEFAAAAFALIAAAVLPLGHAVAQPLAWSGLVLTANERSHSISIVDAHTWQLRNTLHLTVAPHNVQTSEDRRYLYATGNDDDMSHMDMSHMDMSHPNGMDMDMMMEMMEPGYLVAYDLRHPDAAPILSLKLGMHAAHVVVDRANRFAYVTVSGDNAVKVVDLRSKSIAASIAVGKMPHGLRMSPDETRIYVSDMDESAVSVIDVAQRSEVARIPAGKAPVQVAVSPDGRTVYATLGGDNAVAVIDTVSKKLVATIPVGPNPAQLFMAPDGKRVYVANQGTKAAPGHTVSVIDTASRKIAATVEVPNGAHGVVVSPDGAHVFVTDAFDSKLTEIDANTLTARSIDVGEEPNGVTLGR